MQIETFKENIIARLKSKETPLYQKALSLFTSIDSQTNSNTAFFASLAQMMRVAVQEKSIEILEPQLLILNWVFKIYIKTIPHIQVAVIRRIMDSLVDLVLSINIESRLICGVSGQLLVLAQELNTEGLLRLWKNLLEQSISSKRPIRKQAQKSIHEFLSQRTLQISQPYLQELSQHFKINLSDGSAIQFAISLLALITKVIPYSLLVDALYVVISVISDQSKEPYLFLALETILESSIGADQCEKLLAQLIVIQPEDINTCHAYLQALRQCVIALSNASSSQAAQFLPGVLSNMIEFLLHDNLKLQAHCREEIIRIITLTGTRALKLNDLSSDIMSLELESTGTFQQKYLSILSYLLSNRFDHADILLILAAFFRTITEETFHHVQQFILDFVQQKSRFPHVQFQQTMGALAEVLPLRMLLSLFPINLQVDPLQPNFDEISNCWILYILSKYSKGSLQDYFVHLLPFLQILKQINNSNTSEQKVMLNIATHLIDIASNCTIQGVQTPQLEQFVDVILNHLDIDTPYYSNLILMINKLYSKFVSNEVTRNVLRSRAQAYISGLAKIYMSVKTSDLTLSAIKIIAYSADQGYLLRAVNKNMEKILQQKDNFTDANIHNMDIVLQVIGALEFTSEVWDQCVRFASTLINTELQKKIYKFIAEIIRKVHSSFLDQLRDLLIESECGPSAKQKRFQCIQLLLEKQFSETSYKTVEDFQIVLQVFLPEIVIAVRDTNLKTRTTVEKILTFIGLKLIFIDCLEGFMSMIFAGLVGSPHMKADAIATVTLMVSIFHKQIKPEFLDEITQLIILLVKEQNNEVYRAILEYVKVLSKCRSNCLKFILNEIFNGDIHSRDKNIVVIKRILIKLVKQYGLDQIQKDLPAEHYKLLRNALKVDKRTKKNKNKLKRNKQKEVLDELEAKITGQKKQRQKKVDAFDSDIEEVENKPSIQKKQQKGDMEVENVVDNNLLLKYDFNKEQFHFAEPAIKKKTAASEVPEPKQMVEFRDGKVIVQEEKQITGQKRRREADMEEEAVKLVKGEKRSHRKPKESVHTVKESGSVYKPKQSKAGGDVLIKGRPEPFAFIQLNPKALNKRFKQKASKAFDEVFQKSSLKGIKTHK